MALLRFGAFVGVVFLMAAGVVPHAQAKDLDAEIQQKIDTIMRTEDNVKDVTVRVEVAPKNANVKDGIDFSEFDTNHDGVYERDEVGEKLFTIFDRDGNQVIDNLEMKKVGLKVYMPMEKTTISVVDYSIPGKEQARTVTQEEFVQASKLIKFDKNQDGLTPLDFLEMPFNQVNVKNDGVIDLQEWKRAYASSVRPLHMESFHYNN
ncbi:MAG: hypothetical protein IT559_03115 [Alphaproteobacteria bacterium]|nr:hypothetical protein [Alphaproteobacteria bacterium]